MPRIHALEKHQKSDPRDRHNGIHGFAPDSTASCTWWQVDRDLIYLQTVYGCASG